MLRHPISVRRQRPSHALELTPKVKHLLIIVSVLVATVTLAAATAPGVSYQYENKFTWDKKQLDSPPLPVGGEPALAKGLDYPIDLRRRHVEGATTVSITVDSHGRIRSLRFAPHVAPELEKLITAAVYRCQWKPGQRRGQAVTGSVSFPVRFVIARR
jgi:TonB family protein